MDRFFDNYVKNYSDWFVKDNEWGWKDDSIIDEVKRDILGDKFDLYKSQLTCDPIYDSAGNKIKKDNNKSDSNFEIILNENNEVTW